MIVGIKFHFFLLPVAKLWNGPTFKCMAESKKKSAGSGSSSKPRPPESPVAASCQEQVLPCAKSWRCCPSCNWWISSFARLPPRHSVLMDMVYLRDRVAEVEEINDQARQTIEKLDAVVEKLRSLLLSGVGTFLMPVEPDKAHVCVSSTDYVCRLDPQLPLASLQVGQRVLLNEAFAVVQGLGFDRNGPIVRIDELLSGGRLRIGQESGHWFRLFCCVRPCWPRRNSNRAWKCAWMPISAWRWRSLASASALNGRWKRSRRCLGRPSAAKTRRCRGFGTRLNCPFCIAGCLRGSNTRCPRAFMLHGPPGCGKTLLGKATAHNLRQQILAETGVGPSRSFSCTSKAPEILNMWVGESERQVRDLFAQCREPGGGRFAGPFYSSTRRNRYLAHGEPGVSARF